MLMRFEAPLLYAVALGWPVDRACFNNLLKYVLCVLWNLLSYSYIFYELASELRKVLFAFPKDRWTKAAESVFALYYMGIRSNHRGWNDKNIYSDICCSFYVKETHVVFISSFNRTTKIRAFILNVLLLQSSA